MMVVTQSAQSAYLDMNFFFFFFADEEQSLGGALRLFSRVDKLAEGGSLECFLRTT